MGLIITLILIGLLLVFAEILIIPGVGIAGVLGLLAMGGSCAYAFIEMGNLTGIIVTSINAVLLVALTIWVLRAQTWKRLSLETNIDSKAVVPEVEVTIGDKGKSVTRLAPMGTVRFGDKSLEATSMEGLIDPGEEVQVVAIEDSKIYVTTVINNQ